MKQYPLGKPVWVPIDDVIRGEFQIRTRYRLKPVINRYADLIGKLPPIDVFLIDGELQIADGFQRHAAHVQAKMPEIEVIVHKGTVEEAHEFAILANFKHGAPLTAEERNRGIVLLRKMHPKLTLEQLGDKIGVTKFCVLYALKAEAVKEELAEREPDLDYSGVADRALAEIAKADPRYYGALVMATEANGWSVEEVAKKVKEMKGLSPRKVANLLKGEPLNEPGEPLQVGDVLPNIVEAVTELKESRAPLEAVRDVLFRLTLLQNDEEWPIDVIVASVREHCKGDDDYRELVTELEERTGYLQTLIGALKAKKLKLVASK